MYLHADVTNNKLKRAKIQIGSFPSLHLSIAELSFCAARGSVKLFVVFQSSESEGQWSPLNSNLFYPLDSFN